MLYLLQFLCFPVIVRQHKGQKQRNYHKAETNQHRHAHIQKLTLPMFVMLINGRDLGGYDRVEGASHFRETYTYAQNHLNKKLCTDN